MAQFAEATKEIGLVQTISPFLIPKDKQAICNAEVALFTATANLDRQNLLNDFSNNFIVGPVVKKSDFKIFLTEEISLLVIL